MYIRRRRGVRLGVPLLRPFRSPQHQAVLAGHFGAPQGRPSCRVGPPMTSALLRGTLCTCSSLPSCHPRLRLIQKLFGASECQSCGLILRLRLFGLTQRPRSSRRQARQGCRKVGVSSSTSSCGLILRLSRLPPQRPRSLSSWRQARQGCRKVSVGVPSCGLILRLIRPSPQRPLLRSQARQGCRKVGVSRCGLILREAGLSQRPRSSRRQARQCQGCRNVGVSSDPGIGPMTMKSCPPSQQGCALSTRCLVLNAIAQAIGDVPSVDSTTTRPRRIARTTGAWFRRVPQCHVRRRRSGRPRHLSLALPLLGVTAAGGPGPSVGSRMIGSAPIATTTTMPASRLSQQSVVQGGSGFACEVCIDMPFAHCWGLGLETWIHV